VREESNKKTKKRRNAIWRIWRENAPS